MVFIGVDLDQIDKMAPRRVKSAPGPIELNQHFGAKTDLLDLECSVCTPYTIRNNYNSTTNANNNNSKFIYIKRTSTNTADFLSNFFRPENAPFSSFWKQKKNWVDENVKNSDHDNTTLKENVAYMLFKILRFFAQKNARFLWLLFLPFKRGL